MARKLFDDSVSSPISPLIDVVMNGLGAMFIILMIYLVVVRPGDAPEPLQFLADVEPPPAIRGQTYVFTFPVTGGVGKRHFTLEGELPKDLKFHEGSGTLSGVPVSTQRRQFPLHVEVADKSGRATRSATLTLHPIALPYAPALKLSREAEVLPPGRVGVAYEAVLGATGGVEPYTWRLVQGQLPPDLKLQEGRIVGTPRKAGAFRIEVEVSHTAGSFAYQEKRYTWAADTKNRVYQIEIVEGLQHALHVPEGRVGEPYLGVVLTNGRLPGERVHWTVAVPGLQPSDHEGALRGTPFEAGVFPVTYQISHGSTQLGAGSGELRILPKRPAPSVPPAMFQARVGEPVRVAIPYRGLAEPVSVTALQPLPKDLRIVDGGLEGVPEQPGVVPLPVKIEDALGNSATGEVMLHIGPRREPLALDAPETIDFVVGRPVYVHPMVTGGTGEYEWALSEPRPSALAFAPRGAITGVLSGPGRWPLEVSVRDRLTGETASRRITLGGVHADDTKPRLVTTALPTALVGTPFALTFAVVGGIGVPRFSFQGPLPEGLVFTDAGISGTPTRPGSAAFAVTVTDAVGHKDGPKQFILPVEEVDRTLPRVVTNELPPAVPGLPYTQALAAEGGFGAYTWSLSGKLPPKLAFTPDGIIKGHVEPQVQETWPLQIAVRDAKQQSAQPREVILRVAPGWPALTPETPERTALPPAVVGAPYHTRLVAQSCWGACTWAVTKLPEGLDLTREGQMRGTPSKAGTYPLAVSIKDEKGRQASAEYTLQVTDPPQALREPTQSPLRRVLPFVLTGLVCAGGGWLGGVLVGKRVGQRAPFPRRGLGGDTTAG